MGWAAFAAKAPMGWGNRRAHPARWGIGKWGGKWAGGGALPPCQKGALALAPPAGPTGHRLQGCGGPGRALGGYQRRGAPGGPTLQGGALASEMANGQVGCALPPCQKGALAHIAPLAKPTASFKALGAPSTHLVANCLAKQKWVVALCPCSCPKAVGPWVGVPQQLPVYIDSMLVYGAVCNFMF